MRKSRRGSDPTSAFTPNMFSFGYLNCFVGYIKMRKFMRLQSLDVFDLQSVVFERDPQIPPEQRSKHVVSKRDPQIWLSESLSDIVWLKTISETQGLPHTSVICLRFDTQGVVLEPNRP